MFRKLFQRFSPSMTKKLFLGTTVTTATYLFANSHLFAKEDFNVMSSQINNLILLENWKRLGEQLEQYLEEDTSNVTLQIIYTLFLIKIGEIEKADQMLSKMDNHDLTTPDEIYYFGELKFALGDGDAAIAHLESAANMGHSVAQWKYGAVLISQGKISQGFDWIKKAAKSGTHDSKLALALFYQSVEDPEFQDAYKAETLLKELIAANYVPALRSYAILKLQQNDEKGLELLAKSADAGDAMSQLIISKVLQQGGEQKGSFYYALKSYNSGYMESIGTLAQCYLFGVGVDQDVQKGLELIQEGIDVAQNAECMKLAATLLIGGQILQQDYQTAYSLFERCAYNLGDPDCYYYLAEMHLHGLGVPKDQEKGISILQEAVAHGHEHSKKVLNKKLFSLFPEAWMGNNSQDQDENEIDDE